MVDDFKYIILEKDKDSKVAKIVLNRPEKLNALNEAAQSEFLTALQLCLDGVKVIVVTGGGDRSFCTGIDLTELSQVQQRSQSSSDTDTWIKVCLAIKSHPSVVIASVNGFALGGGLTLVNVSDLAIAADDATFGMPEIKFGAFPRLAGPSTSRRIAPKNVNWMALTAEKIDAPTAMSWGVVNKVVPRCDLGAYVQNLAEEIAKFDSIALTWTKRGLAAVETMDMEKSLEFGSYVRAMVMKERGAN